MFLVTYEVLRPSGEIQLFNRVLEVEIHVEWEEKLQKGKSLLDGSIIQAVWAKDIKKTLPRGTQIGWVVDKPEKPARKKRAPVKKKVLTKAKA